MMRTISATDLARNISRILDELERGGGEVVVVRNGHPVARLIPGAPRLTALEALSDLHRTLDDAEGESWLADMRNVDRLLVREMRDPWA